MSILLIFSFFLLGLLALPIAHALLAASALSVGIFNPKVINVIVEQMVSQSQSFPLIAIPFFMLTGSLMMGGKLGQSLISLVTLFVGRFHGGPAQVGVLSSTVFGGVSGSAVADASAIGSLLIPWQKKIGYPPAFSAATLASAATIDILIPPSIPFILYALASGASIGALFYAGILPGLLLCFGFMAVCYLVGRSRDFPRVTEVMSRREFWRLFAYSAPALVMPVLIVVLLRFGIATPTEVSILTTLYALLASALIYRDITVSRLMHSVMEAAVSTGVVLLIIMTSSVVGWIITFDQMPAVFTKFANEVLQEKWLIILAMNLLMLVVGMFMDLPAAVLLLAPIFVPLAQSVGMDTVQLGVMMVVNLAIGLYTPPVGTTLFITSSVAGVKIGATVKELIPFYGVALLILGLVSYVPAFILR
jgi:tripartite ATP-independent transporter DctM subunit